VQRMGKRGNRLPLACPPSPSRPQAPRACTRRVPRRSGRGTSVESSSSNGQPRARYSFFSGHAERHLCNGWTNEGTAFPSLLCRRHHVRKHHEHVLDACCAAQVKEQASRAAVPSDSQDIVTRWSAATLDPRCCTSRSISPRGVTQTQTNERFHEIAYIWSVADGDLVSTL
jgi:hypothetical protein